MPKQYRLIPFAVEAIQLRPDTVKKAAVWCGGIEVEEIDAHDSTKKFVALNIPTINGVVRASEGDYIIKELAGTVSVMKARDFESRYELV